MTLITMGIIGAGRIGKLHADNLLNGKSRIRVKGENCWFSLTAKSNGKYKGYGCGGAVRLRR